MRTPRPSTPNRRNGGVNTLIGYGWLKEAPKNLWPRAWDIKSRSALRKCVFMPIPPDARAFLESLPPAQPVIATPAIGNNVAPVNRPPTPHARRKDPVKDARMFGAVSPEEVAAAQKRKLYAEAQARLVPHHHGHHQARPMQHSQPPAIPGLAAWYEDPVALGTLLILFPPVGLAALWASNRYSNDARWALTVMTGLVLCLATAVVIAVSMLH